MTLLENITLNFTNPADICLGESQYSPDCLNKWFCPQISDYFTNTALIIIIIYILITWLLWAYWRWVHDKIDWVEIIGKYPLVGSILGPNPLEFEAKVRIELFVRDKLEKVLVGFIFVLWWFYR